MTTTNAAIKCGYCGKPAHGSRCPEVKALEYHPDGTVKRVEFMTPSDYMPQSQASAPIGPITYPPFAPVARPSFIPSPNVWPPPATCVSIDSDGRTINSY